MLGKIVTVIIIILLVLFGSRIVLGGIITTIVEIFGKADVSYKSPTWEENFKSSISRKFNELQAEAAEIQKYCVDLHNYNQILSESKNEDKFIQKYINNPSEGLQCYGETGQKEKEDFLVNFLTGELEKFRYLLEEDGGRPILKK